VLLVYVALLGLAIGSFLNVVIYRLPLGQSLLKPPSRCRKCGYSLRWFDNIPVLSWLLLAGKCRKCREPISIQYPIVELITGSLFLLIAWMTPDPLLLVSRLVLVSILIALFGIDLEHQILPNAITLPAIVIGMIFNLAAPPGIRDAIIGALLGGGILYGIAAAYYLVRREEGLGMGDVKMLAMVGAFLGWKAVLVTLVLSSFSGAVIGVGLIAMQKIDRSTDLQSQSRGMRVAMPFGTFLAVGALAAMLAGDPLVAWYAQFFNP
jgi:leader peptidase (prepilin peptidase)/N-methyltransferase